MDDLKDTGCGRRDAEPVGRRQKAWIGFSQPKLSRRLRALEDTVGARLFDRLPTGLAPTPAGERLIPLVADMAVAAEAVERRAPSLPATATGTVRISALETLCVFLGENMDELCDIAPGLSFELITNHADVSLSRREADLLIRACLPDGASLVARRITDLAYAVYGNHDYVARHPAARSGAMFPDCIGSALPRIACSSQAPSTGWMSARIVRRWSA